MKALVALVGALVASALVILLGIFAWEWAVLLAVPLPWFAAPAMGGLVVIHWGIRLLRTQRARAVVLAPFYAAALAGIVASIGQWIFWGIAFNESDTAAGVSSSTDRWGDLTLHVMAASACVICLGAIASITMSYVAGRRTHPAAPQLAHR